MQPAPLAPTEISFAVEFGNAFGSSFNADLQGRGTLRIPSDGSGFIFSGMKRTWLSRARSIDVVYGSDQIWNAVADGRRIQFETMLGESGAKNRPFVFFCHDEKEAAEVMALLPTTVSAESGETHAFEEKLRQVSAIETPWASPTNLIIGVNALVFVVMGVLGAGWIEVDDMMPYIRYGANNGAATTDGEWWRLGTSVFMHFGILHLLLNMWALFQAGHLLERLLGRPLYLLAYLGSGLVGSLASVCWNRDEVWSAGASGAVFGVYGAVLGYMLREKHALPKSVFRPMVKSSLTFAGYNLVFGAIHPQIDNAAHLGGLGGGVVLGWLLALPLDRDARTQLAPRRMRAGLMAVAASVIAGVLLAPRFDYRVADEIAWSDINGAQAVREQDLLQRQNRGLASHRPGEPAPELIALLEGEVLPFYDGWRQILEEIDLAPGRTTERRRETLVRVLRMKITSLENLIARLRAHAADAIPQFQAEEALTAIELAKLSPP